MTARVCVSHHSGVAEVQCIPAEPLRKAVWLLSDIIFIRLDAAVCCHHLSCTRKQEVRHKHDRDLLTENNHLRLHLQHSADALIQSELYKRFEVSVNKYILILVQSVTV